MDAACYVQVMYASCYAHVMGALAWSPCRAGQLSFFRRIPNSMKCIDFEKTVLSTSTAAADTTVMSEAHSVGVHVAMLCIMHKKIYHK